MEITVKVPATSANLGPGFDVVGLALNIFCEVTYKTDVTSFEIKGCPLEFANKNNLAYVSFEKTLAYRKLTPPNALQITIKSDIPISRGLGSSSALTVAGIIAADKLYNLNLSSEEKLLLAAQIEGHPDNAAPCLLGGFVTTWVENGKCFANRIPVSDSLKFALIIPEFQVPTKEAREILPALLKREDAVFNLAHLGLLLNGISSGDPQILKEALNDRIHQPYRKKLIPCFDKYHNLCLSYKALGLVISGSGSTMLIIGNQDTDFDTIQQESTLIDSKAVFKEVSPCFEGAVVTAIVV